MKLYNNLIWIMLLFFSFSVSAATINGKFTVLNSTGSDFTILIQINTSIGTNDLGGATIVFGFDSTAIRYSSDPVNGVDYIFHNFSGGNYSPATVTRPMNNRIWVNIDLPFTNNNNGTPISISPDWTDVVTIHFDVVNASYTADLDWLTTSPFWGIYDADNSTLWEIGEFENFPTSIEPNSDLPMNYELGQNYPNPFNPSTMIRYSIPYVGRDQNVPVQLKVYDILGNEVATLVNEVQEPGIYEVNFSASNLASGIYFYCLYGSQLIGTKKMVLIR